MSSEHNPFAAPQSEIGAPVAPSGLVLASLGNRFLGLMVDSVVSIGAAIVGMVIGLVLAAALGLPFDDGYGEPGAAIWVGMGIGGFFMLPVTGVQWYLISTRGQSIAKIMLGMKIVQEDGSPVGFFNGVFLRIIAFTFISAIVQVFSCGLLGWVVTLVDGGLVFRDNRQTLHDMIAKTIVIEA